MFTANPSIHPDEDFPSLSSPSLNRRSQSLTFPILSWIVSHVKFTLIANDNKAVLKYFEDFEAKLKDRDAESPHPSFEGSLSPSGVTGESCRVSARTAEVAKQPPTRTNLNLQMMLPSEVPRAFADFLVRLQTIHIGHCSVHAHCKTHLRNIIFGKRKKAEDMF